jgi:FtsP/CotA-like multicopper oxidase with cupredoxin domain
MARTLVLPPLLLLAAHTAACQSPADQEPVGTPPSEDSPVPVSPIQACNARDVMPDTDPDPTRVEVDLRASDVAWDPGTGTPLLTGMAFNDSVPGPILEANLGDTVTVHFQNDTTIPMALHWHGLRVTPEMDGIQQMTGDPVAPGERFDYVFTLRDAGFYWFHTHMDTASTIEAGLQAPIIVHAPGETAPDCDLPLVLDDVLLDEDTRQIAPPDTDMMRIMGRLGNLLMANGQAGRRIAWTAGQTTLLRLVNSSNARIWDVALEGHTMRVVGSDGGFLETPYDVERVRLSPGERVMVVVEATGEPGRSYRLMNRRVQLHGHGGHMVEVDPMGDGENPVLTFVYDEGRVTGSGWTQPTPDAPSWTSPPAVFGHGWLLEEDMMAGTVTLDGAAWPDGERVTVTAHVDTTFTVENASEMHHPFHIHGNRFQVLDDGHGVPTPGWKDTFDIPPRSTVTLASALDNPGEWMVHCHILEHGDEGMAGMMLVAEEGSHDAAPHGHGAR